MAEFSSCTGGLAVVMTPIREEFHLPLWVAATIGTAAITLVGIPLALSMTSLGLKIGNKSFLDVMDQISSSGVVIVAGIVGATLITWLVPRSGLLEAMNSRFHHGWIVYIGWYPFIGAALLMSATLLLKFKGRI